MCSSLPWSSHRHRPFTATDVHHRIALVFSSGGHLSETPLDTTSTVVSQFVWIDRPRALVTIHALDTHAISTWSTGEWCEILVNNTIAVSYFTRTTPCLSISIFLLHARSRLDTVTKSTSNSLISPACDQSFFVVWWVTFLVSARHHEVRAYHTTMPSSFVSCIVLGLALLCCAILWLYCSRHSFSTIDVKIEPVSILIKLVASWSMSFSYQPARHIPTTHLQHEHFDASNTHSDVLLVQVRTLRP